MEKSCTTCGNHKSFPMFKMGSCKAMKWKASYNWEMLSFYNFDRQDIDCGSWRKGRIPRKKKKKLMREFETYVKKRYKVCLDLGKAELTLSDFDLKLTQQPSDHLFGSHVSV